jgi:uncharacterized membrane protein YfhO
VSAKKKQNLPKETPQAVVSEPKTASVDFFDTIGSKAVYVALGVLLLIAFFVFRHYLLLENVYFFKDIGSDTYNYTFPTLYNTADQISKYGMPGWSFNRGMGQSMFPFFLRDPFEIFVYAGGAKNIVYTTAFKEFAKVVLSGLVFYYYLRALGLSAFTRIAGSVFFSFSGFMIMGGSWSLFSFEAFNLALLLLAFEQLFSSNKWYLFPIAIFLIGISQPFNLYVYGLLLAGYAILRMYHTGKYDVKGGSLFFLKMAGLGVIGVLLSGPLMLENVVQLLESPRGSGNTSYANVLSSVPMFQSVDKFQLGTAVMRFFASDMLGAAAEFKGWQNTLEAPLFYCGLPCLLLMPQIFPILDKKLKIFFVVFLLIWLLPVFFPYFRYAYWMFTGDYYRAYSIAVVTFVMYYALMALDKIVTEQKVHLVTLIVTLVVLLLLLNYPFFPEGDIKNSPVYTFVTFMLLVYTGLLFFMGKAGSAPYLKYIFIGAIAMEAMFLSGVSVNERDPVTVEELSEKVGYNDNTMDVLQKLNASDKSFFRIDKSYASSPAIHYSLNDAMAQGYRSTSSYNPFNQLYYIRYLQLMGASDKNNEQDSRWARGLLGRPILESANRVKYLLAKSEVMPIWRVLGDSIATMGDVRVFRNKFLLPFGYTYNKYIRESVFSKLSNTQKDFLTLKACVVADEEVSKVTGLKEFNLADTVAESLFTFESYKQGVDELGKDSMITEKWDDTRIVGKINVSDSKIMYLSVPYDEGWKLRVDGKEQQKQVVFAGMTGIMLPKGQHTIEMVFGLRYINKGLLLMLIGLLAYAGVWFITRNKVIVAPPNAAE